MIWPVTAGLPAAGALASRANADMLIAVGRVRVFVLYVVLAMGGACAPGYAANWLVG